MGELVDTAGAKYVILHLYCFEDIVVTHQFLLVLIVAVVVAVAIVGADSCLLEVHHFQPED